VPLIDELLGSHSLDDGSDDDSKILPMSKSTMALVVCSPVRHQIAHEIRGRSRPAGAISACRRNLGLPAQPRPAGAISACRHSSASMGRPYRPLDALPAIPLAGLNLA